MCYIYIYIYIYIYVCVCVCVCVYKLLTRPASPVLRLGKGAWRSGGEDMCAGLEPPTARRLD